MYSIDGNEDTPISHNIKPLAYCYVLGVAPNAAVMQCVQLLVLP